MSKRRDEISTVYMHSLLRGAAKLQIEKFAFDSRGRGLFCMTANLLIFCTLEAYLNFVGERALPEKWKDEKTEFSKKPYQGVLGKLKFLCAKATVNLEDHPSYPTIRVLKGIRDKISHGRTQIVPISFVPKDEFDLGRMPFLHDQPDPELSLKSIETICDDINAGLRAVGLPNVPESAFDGVVAESSGSEFG